MRWRNASSSGRRLKHSSNVDAFGGMLMNEGSQGTCAVSLLNKKIPIEVNQKQKRFV